MVQFPTACSHDMIRSHRAEVLLERWVDTASQPGAALGFAFIFVDVQIACTRRARLSVRTASVAR